MKGVVYPFQRRDARPLALAIARASVQDQTPPPEKRAIGTLERIGDHYVITLPVCMGAQMAERLCSALIKGAFPISSRGPA